MVRNRFFLLLFVCVLCAGAHAEKPAVIDNFTLNDYNGTAHSLADYRNSKAVVVMFIATRCPVSNSYNSRMEQLYEDYARKGVAFVGINSNSHEDAAEVRSHAMEHHLAFTILKDPGNVVADKFGALVTPEIYVLDGGLNVLYHGRIDDSHNEQQVKSRDLRHALDEILSGKKVSVAETKAFGCTIKRSQNP